jgi:hypothetical protein
MFLKSGLVLSALTLLAVVAYHKFPTQHVEIISFEGYEAVLESIPCDEFHEDSVWNFTGGSSHGYTCSTQGGCSGKYDYSSYTVWQNTESGSVLAHVKTFVDGKLDNCEQQEFVKTDEI